jgi:glucose-6-phosphate 1-dehydrogenase
MHIMTQTTEQTSTEATTQPAVQDAAPPQPAPQKAAPAPQPEHDVTATDHPLPDCNIVIFGATGDLTHRKLMPALFSLETQKLLPANTKIIGFARRQFSDQSFREEIKTALQEFSPDLWKEGQSAWKKFSQRIFFHRSDFDNTHGFTWLKDRLNELDTKSGACGNRLFYLATPPAAYSQIVKQLKLSGLTQCEKTGSSDPFVRIIVEKPFGSDLDSARALNQELKAVFRERQIYRIDHYLGKETVQNIFVFRFANAIFEPIWNQNYVDNVQITVGETVGVETRAGYFDKAGELRDMVQSHAMQLLTLGAKEPPIAMEANAVRDEKVKVLKSLRPIAPSEVEDYTVRAQYTAGFCEGKQVPGYRQEPGVPPNSLTDTFVALRIGIDNWRWAGVPFYIRAGKRMSKRLTEINIEFKHVPQILLASMSPRGIEPNRLTIRIQPDEGITFRLGAKPPGQKTTVAPVELDFTYGRSFGQRIHDAYERLLMDAMMGDASLFTRDDEAEAEWSFITPILEGWAQSLPSTMREYPAGTWGPPESTTLIGEVHPKRRWLDHN